ncbi:DUF2878 domain-containing protein [Stenotrophomonas sp. CFBP 13718]|uniref:DUF2878 domain-containing protein n=1 Tax=Stenotrophomonas sp. CFBP 13718 TaxID=2775304 RepID=UPI00177CAE7C|nr:DUF2878 domain-containing protein [Stenotrophomonas sp. CFBP 13718]MBD8697989.1 DUF2878 domain-containing protein [Stenotrophomonas sp. CFBP 13718]
MHFWGNVIGNQLVWFCAVAGAGRGQYWPAVLAATAYIVSQLLLSAHPSVELKLMAVAIVCGLLVDGVAGASGLVVYAAGTPAAWLAPVWILALWASFAMTLTVSFAALQRQWRLAALVGLLLAPLAYLSAARGFSSVAFATPAWRGIAVLGMGWSLALPALAACARRWQRPYQRSARLQSGEGR